MSCGLRRGDGGCGWRAIAAQRIDDAPEPAIDVPLLAAFDGSAGPLFAPPFGLGATDRMVWMRPVVFARRLVVAFDHVGVNDLVYHQVTVRRDPPGSLRTVPATPGTAADDAAAALARTPTGTAAPATATTSGGV